MEIIAANGDRLYAEGTGKGIPTGEISYITEWYTITGGTGRFADAAGSFTLTRQVNRLTGAVQGAFVGTVSVP